MKSKSVVLTIVVTAALLLFVGAAFPGTDGRLDLSGAWKFRTDPTNVGLEKSWQAPQFDASSWKSIEVPGAWESQGITQVNPDWRQSDDLNQPYTGYAWYRRAVQIPADWHGRYIELELGQIDDMDWTYFNGKLIGKTTDRGESVSSIHRSYKVPVETVKFGGTNMIAVRVLDFRGLGGIVGGPVSIEESDPGTPGRPSDKVRAGGSVTVEKSETAGDAVAMFGDVTVKGHVTGDAVALMGSVLVRDGGKVDGDAVAVGGTVIKEDDAYVGGDVVSTGGWGWSVKRFAPEFSKKWFASAFVGRFVDFWGSVLFALLAAIVVALFPRRMETVAEVTFERAGLSALYAIAGWLLIVPVAVLLLVTCIGIPLIAVEVLLVIVAWIAGSVGVGLALGRKVGEALSHPIASPVLAVFIGALILGVVGLVPVAGDLVVFVLSLLGFGAALLTGFGADSDWLPRRFLSPPPTQ